MRILVGVFHYYPVCLEGVEEALKLWRPPTGRGKVSLFYNMGGFPSGGEGAAGGMLLCCFDALLVSVFFFSQNVIGHPS